MKRIGAELGGFGPRLLGVARPEPGPGPGPGEVLARELRVGVDGTSHEFTAGNYGSTPPGAGILVLGYGTLGVGVDPSRAAFEPNNRTQRTAVGFDSL